jgi:hypothetical protein
MRAIIPIKIGREGKSIDPRETKPTSIANSGGVSPIIVGVLFKNFELFMIRTSPRQKEKFCFQKLKLKEKCSQLG